MKFLLQCIQAGEEQVVTFCYVFLFTALTW